MCYSIYVSTTSKEDLAGLPEDHFQFQRIEGSEIGNDLGILALLAYPERWLLLCKYGGCSCHFRHLGEVVGGRNGRRQEPFGVPEDWMPEDEEDLESTKAVFDALSLLLSKGNQVDLIDVWTDTAPDSVQTLNVSLGEVPRDAFRFLEGYRMCLSP
jgi:hypothetical protein